MDNIIFKGLLLDNHSALDVWDGKSDLIIEPKHFRFAIKNKYYLLDGEHCYGVIKLTGVSKIPPSEFSDLVSRHNIDNIERIKRWKTGNKIMYGYEFELIERYVKPRRVLVLGNKQTFIDKVIFVNNPEDIVLEDVDNYTPNKISSEQLFNDWMSISKLLLNRGVEVVDRGLFNVVRSIFLELLNRVRKDHHNRKYLMSMFQHTNELYTLVYNNIDEGVSLCEQGVIPLKMVLLEGANSFVDLNELINHLYPVGV